MAKLSKHFPMVMSMKANIVMVNQMDKENTHGRIQSLIKVGLSKAIGMEGGS